MDEERGPPLPPAPKRGAPIKYRRPVDCPHPDAPEHQFGSCRKCTKIIFNRTNKNKKAALKEKIKELEEENKQLKKKQQGKFISSFLCFSGACGV
jgi:radical SAM superfamily enzyme